jgi:hypothetical protein
VADPEAQGQSLVGHGGLIHRHLQW